MQSDKYTEISQLFAKLLYILVTLRMLNFFSMSTDFRGICTIAVCIVYASLLLHITGRKRNTDALIKAFVLVFLAGWVLHLSLFTTMAATTAKTLTDWLLMLFFSAQYSLEMFLAKTIAFKGSIYAILVNHPILQTGIFTVYFMAIITSASIIFHFVSRWAYGRRWLFRRQNIKAAEEGGNHIFIGLNEASRLLAADIRKEGCRGKIIFIDIPDEADTPRGISVWDLINRFFFREREDDCIEADVILKAGKRMTGLLPWLRNADNTVYILSDDQKSNISIAEKLWQREGCQPENQFKCRIYCHANRDSLAYIYSSVTDVQDRIRFVDSSFLAIESLKSHTSAETYPVSYVRKAKNPATGRLAGYVESQFTSAIIGFGETGMEALKFLYEFGIFIGKDKQKIPFECRIFDKAASVAAGELKRKIYFPDEDRIEFRDCHTESESFWDSLGEIIHKVNYIIVALGDDQNNLKTAIDIAEFAMTNGRDIRNDFTIVFRQEEFSPMDKETVDKANRTYCGCLRPFGLLKDIWKLSVIKADDITAMAKRFYCGYLSATTVTDAEKAWTERMEKLLDDDYEIRNKARRQITQDYSNCLHTITKKALCSPETRKSAASIMPDYHNHTHIDSGQCSQEDASVLEYLAIGEHIRWAASHTILGYRYDTETSDLRHTHRCLVPYDELSGLEKHYDWLVVRNSL